MSFKNINAVISGGASGLGLGVATEIVNQGGKVAVLDINAESAKINLKPLVHGAIFYQVDITSDNDVDNAMDQISNDFGRIDLVISCAGILGNGRLHSKKGPMPSEFFRKVIDVNLMGAFYLTRAATRLMALQEPTNKGERGVIVHTASIAAYEGQLGQLAYSATKSAIVGMILPLAREFSKKGIRVMAIAPGMFETPMLDNVSDEIREALCASVPFPSRFGKPSEFAQMVEQILDNAMLNGSVIRLDGAARLQ